MKVYRVYYFDDAVGPVSSWHSTREAATGALNRARTEFPNDRPAGLEAVEVPARKPDLIAWLNHYAKTDNG